MKVRKKEIKVPNRLPKLKLNLLPSSIQAVGLDSSTAPHKSFSSGTCVSCLAGKVGDWYNPGSCTDCAGGTYSTDGTQECIGCGTGQFSGLGSGSCTDCAAGKHLNTKTTGDETSACTTCATGKYSGTAAEICTACEAGKRLVEGATGDEVRKVNAETFERSNVRTLLTLAPHPPHQTTPGVCVR